MIGRTVFVGVVTFCGLVGLVGCGAPPGLSPIGDNPEARMYSEFWVAKRIVEQATDTVVDATFGCADDIAAEDSGDELTVACFDRRSRKITVGLRGYRNVVCAKAASADNAYMMLRYYLVHELLHAYQEQALDHHPRPAAEGLWIRVLREGHATAFADVLVPEGASRARTPGQPAIAGSVGERRRQLMWRLLYVEAPRYVLSRCGSPRDFAILLDETIDYARIAGVETQPDREASDASGLKGPVTDAVKWLGVTIDAPCVTVGYLDAMAILAPQRFLEPGSLMAYRGGAAITGTWAGNHVDCVVLVYDSPESARNVLGHALAFRRARHDNIIVQSPTEFIVFGGRSTAIRQDMQRIIIVDARDRSTCNSVMGAIEDSLRRMK